MEPFFNLPPKAKASVFSVNAHKRLYAANPKRKGIFPLVCTGKNYSGNYDNNVFPNNHAAPIVQRTIFVKSTFK